MEQFAHFAIGSRRVTITEGDDPAGHVAITTRPELDYRDRLALTIRQT
jgi:hypothetical protein